ncbi:rcc01693 family protein [Loktanella sp. M215]|uniref:rcc01693 family protein n=1 Tax=Loktanella sp. M215 TaxID=2675431 RepID=UPI001F48974D|nr:rcc01693 family protein [Loktanella sp. M215]MBU2358244.1 phage tail assembly chaperone [Alphaproteobacteria bacterium]MCF7700332.1 phage tail assembly chaperone [Loktanella sp. M215]
MTGALDWAGLMRAGLHGLRLTPDQFWRLTPAELALMLGQGAQARPLGRAALDDLMTAYPDAAKGALDE